MEILIFLVLLVIAVELAVIINLNTEKKNSKQKNSFLKKEKKETFHGFYVDR